MNISEWGILIKQLLFGTLAVSLISLLYLGLQYGWIVASGSLDPPHYTSANRALRQSFFGSIVAMLALWVLGLGPLRRLVAGRTSLAILLMAMGVTMTVMGLGGMLVVLTVWGELSQPRGLTPDYGHTLTYQNFTGALWLFLLSGVVPFTVGYSAAPRPRSRMAPLGLLVVMVAPVYFAGYAAYLGWRFVAAP